MDLLRASWPRADPGRRARHPVVEPAPAQRLFAAIGRQGEGIVMAARESDADWRFFLQDAAGHIDASRLAACFDGAVPASLSQQMLENERLRTRLSALVQTHY